ncbi:MAG: homoserine O-succinyltransferase [Chitinivibrionales bacterium]|nr:homoserine O-succinyltransferase [Chitinivibrionales bacterium]
MTIVVPQHYHAKGALEKRRIECISEPEALRQDIRALRIGILNVMPQAETYEFSLLFPLGRSIIQIEPIWIRLNTHAYNSTPTEHLDNWYIPFEDAIAEKHLDGLILTGAPVEEIPFEQVNYWPEVQKILAYARTNIASTLGICWGGLALAKFLGIEKVMFPKKLFGVFEARNIDHSHDVTGEMDDVFWSPQSRHSGIPDQELEARARAGEICLLAHSQEAGYFIFESSDHKFLIHLGHPEYDAQRLVVEYKRDTKKGRTDVERPINVDIENPLNRWRGHCLEFFQQWIKYVYETTPF